MNRLMIGTMLVSVLVCAGFGCREDVPIREMTSARAAINDAVEVQADRYAPDEIKAARGKLMESHKFVSEEKPDDAKKSADKSRENAIEAYNKALPLLAKDTITSAERAYESATEAYAEVLAKSQMAAAKTDIQEANRLFEDKKFYPSYKTALEGERKARLAREASFGSKTILSDSIEDVNVTIAKSKQYHAERYAPDKLRLAEEHVGIASQSLKGQKLKEGFSAVGVAKMNADEAYQVSVKGSSRDAIAEARSLVAQAEQSPGASVAGTDLAMAKESLKNSESYYSEAKYRESIAAAEDSRRLAQTVITASARAKVSLAGKGEEGQEVDKAVVGKEAGKVSDEERGYRIYVVKYAPARRDCLWRIADKFYGDGRKWQRIHEANKDMIANPRIIQPGWRIKVPLEGIVERPQKKGPADPKN